MTGIVILAGGKSSRMGRDKLRLPYKGGTFLSSAAERFASEFENVYISVGDMSKYDELPFVRIPDEFPGHGPIGGIHAAMKYTGGDVFAVAGDLPFSDPAAAKRLISMSEGYDAVVPLNADGRPEPLFAWYSHGILSVLEDALSEGANKLAAIFDKINVKYVTPAILGGSDSLFDNINRPEDYERLADKASEV